MASLRKTCSDFDHTLCIFRKLATSVRSQLQKTQHLLVQDKGGYGDSAVMDQARGRGVQFPFAVTDGVIIKDLELGKQEDTQRFVGCEAVVTTRCLNGWYVVKTLDNAESVKLQYRSLAKVSDDPVDNAESAKLQYRSLAKVDDDPSSKAIPTKLAPH